MSTQNCQICLFFNKIITAVDPFCLLDRATGEETRGSCPGLHNFKQPPVVIIILPQCPLLPYRRDVQDKCLYNCCVSWLIEKTQSSNIIVSRSGTDQYSIEMIFAAIEGLNEIYRSEQFGSLRGPRTSPKKCKLERGLELVPCLYLAFCVPPRPLAWGAF